MAMRFYGLNRGQSEFGSSSGASVVEGAATGSTDVEVRVDLTKSLTKDEVVRLIDGIENFILKNYSKTFNL